MQPPADFNLVDHVLAPAQRDPDKIALAVLGPSRAERWSYGRLADAVARAAGGLKGTGLPRGSHIMLRLTNSATFPLLSRFNFGGIHSACDLRRVDRTRSDGAGNGRDAGRHHRE